jgi:hypothetical protein
MATVNGYIVVDNAYAARRLGPEPPSTTCAVSTTVTPSPYFYVKNDEAAACFSWISCYREPSRLVVIELDDQGDVAWQHAAGSSLTTWFDEGWGWVPVKRFDVVDEMTPSEIRTIVSANINTSYPPTPQMRATWGI